MKTRVKLNMRNVKLRAQAKAAKRGDLTSDIAGAKVGTVRDPWGDKSVVAGLTPQRLARIIRSANQGNTEDYLVLAMEMEERDPHYGSVLALRKRAVQSLPISIEPADESAQAAKIAEAVKTDILEQPEFIELLHDCLDAIGKGYAAVEIIWERGTVWKPDRYEWRDPRWFQFDDTDARTLRLRDESDPNGLELERHKWVLHTPKQKSGLPVRGGLARLAAWSFLFKNYAVKDWVVFLEAYGMPIRIGKYGPSATEDDKDKLFRAVMGIGTDQAAVIPESMKIEFEQAMSGATNAQMFERMADWCDRQVSKAVIGATMVTDEGSSGGYAQSKTHDSVRDDIRDDDARQLGVTINKSVIRDYVDFNFGPQENYPIVTLVTEEEEDLDSWSKRTNDAIDRGLEVDQEDYREQLGLPKPKDGAKLMRPMSGGAAALHDAAPEPDTELTRALVQSLTTKLARATPQDDIDVLADEAVTAWEMEANDLTEAIIDLAERSKTKQAFERGLNSLAGKGEQSRLARALGQAFFTARGLGDGAD